MATISVVVPDAALPRIRAAFNVAGTPATTAVLQARIKSFIISRVMDYETEQAANASRETISNDVGTW